MGRRLEPQESLGRAVRALRLERGLTQRELARAADLNVTWLSHIEAGRPNPAWGTVARIAAALDVPVSELALRAERIDADQS
ncbi:helix-turn-helix transcriptional regulator [Thermoleophilia bacterium SCSIO 60948]|nr:helix-turn-helix transcriptional regulator [Thermoleophilia bacterium SCSIO 60948]